MGFFLPLASLRCTSASPPATRQNSPGIWMRRFPPRYVLYLRFFLFLFPTPLDHKALRDQNPSAMKRDTCVQTEAAQNRAVHELNGSTREGRGGETQCKSTRVGIYADRGFFRPPSTQYPSRANHETRHCHAYVHVLSGSMREGRGEDATWQYSSASTFHLPRSTPPLWLAHSCS
ncbi:hypothetical protein BJV74DRAFT_58088 [Russula compacta]|nr:hypothetical protein BJV74DRAFT_58088 [Russula compacta]